MKALYFLSRSNLVVAMAAPALTWQFYSLTHTEIDIRLLWFAFTSTFFCYHFQRFAKVLNNVPISSDTVHWIKLNNSLIKGLLLLSGSIALVLGLGLELTQVILIGGICVVGFFYTLKFPFSNYSVRTIPLAKGIVVALVWTIVTVLLPSGAEDLHSNAFLAMHIFFLILSLTICSDIRDKDIDKPESITLVQRIGVPYTKLLAILLYLISAICICCPFGHFPALICSSGFAIVAILGCEKGGKEYYYGLLVDGLLVIQPALIVLLPE